MDAQTWAESSANSIGHRRRPATPVAGSPPRAGRAFSVLPDAPLTPAAILSLQRTAGNASVGVLVQRAIAVRGGTCTPESFTKGSGVTTDEDDKLSGVSVSTDKFREATLEGLCAGIPHNQVGVADTDAVDQQGGSLADNPTKRNRYHALLSGLTAVEASKLFNEGRRKNPLK